MQANEPNKFWNPNFGTCKWSLLVKYIRLIEQNGGFPSITVIKTRLGFESLHINFMIYEVHMNCSIYQIVFRKCSGLGTLWIRPSLMKLFKEAFIKWWSHKTSLPTSGQYCEYCTQGRNLTNGLLPDSRRKSQLVLSYKLGTINKWARIID